MDSAIYTSRQNTERVVRDQLRRRSGASGFHMSTSSKSQNRSKAIHQSLIDGGYESLHDILRGSQ